MKCMTQIDKRNKLITLFAIFLIILCGVSIYSMRKRNIQAAEEELARQEEEKIRLERDWAETKEKKAVEIEGYFKEKEKEYIDFEKLFRENEDDLQKFMDLSQESILKEKEYFIVFDRETYSKMGSTGEWITLLYTGTFSSKENEEVAENLNKNDELKKILDSIKEKGVITSIDLFYIEEYIQIVAFRIDTKFTPFITDNNGLENAFAWCNSEDCKIYGYKNVEENWYMWISPAPE